MVGHCAGRYPLAVARENAVTAANY